jgi:hypothetical protein
MVYLPVLCLVPFPVFVWGPPGLLATCSCYWVGWGTAFIERGLSLMILFIIFDWACSWTVIESASYCPRQFFILRSTKKSMNSCVYWTFYPISILWKMTVFIWKPAVTSSNCYKTMKNASILMKLSTYINWPIASVTRCSIVNLL